MAIPSSTPQQLTDSERWKALTRRDPAYASSFVYAVITTRIYCRPNCPSRLARRANIIFFANAAAAAADKAGFRACKRCRPGEVNKTNAQANVNVNVNSSILLGAGEKISRAMTIIVQRSSAPATTGTGPTTTTTTKRKKAPVAIISLAELAREVGLSKWHLQREFKRRIGLTPREMAERLAASAGAGASAGANQEEYYLDEQQQTTTGSAQAPISMTTMTTRTESTGNPPWDVAFPLRPPLPPPLLIGGGDDGSDFDYFNMFPDGCELLQPLPLTFDDTILLAEPESEWQGQEQEQDSVLHDLFPDIYMGCDNQG